MTSRSAEHLLRAASRGATAVVVVATLAACGGGGGDSNPFTPPPPTSSSNWQRGVFAPSGNFKASCAAPRSGIDPATGSPFADVDGTRLDEMDFLRSYSNETYLWYDEIFDRDPSLYSNVLDYFDELVTTRTDANGEPVDKFHFTYDTYEYFQLAQTGVSAGYGITFNLGSPLPPRNVVIAFVEPGSQAAGLDLTRGTRILSINGVDIDDDSAAGVAVLNDALFPNAPGRQFSFEVQYQNGLRRTVALTSRSVSIDPVPVTEVLTLPDQRRVGYMLFNDHIATAELALIQSVEQLNAGAGIDELVVDLRYNGGGYLALASQLSYMIAGTDATANRTFELLQFNDKHPTTNPITGRAIAPTPFYSNTLGPPFNGPIGMALPTLNVSGVTIITGAGTCSASEAIINGLRGIEVPVTLVGERTCGKPYGFYPQDNCGTTYFTVQFRGVNAMDFGDYANGFVASNTTERVGERVNGCEVADDFSHELGDPNEGRLATALGLMQGASCPSINRAQQKAGAPDSRPRGRVLKPLALQNAIALP